MPLHLKSPVSTDDLRRQAFEALLTGVAERAGPFLADHAALGESFFGVRLRVLGEELSLSHRPGAESPVVAVHRSAGGTRRYCLGPGAWGALARRVESTADVLHGHEVELDRTLAARQPLAERGTVVFQDRWWDHWQDHEWVHGGTLGAWYKTVLHPLIGEFVCRELLRALPEKPRILDLGGGSGSLLMQLGQWAHLVERNTRQVAMADARPDRCFEIHQGDVRQLPDFGAVAGGPVHLALAVGLLNLHVMAPTEAWRVAHGLFADLAPGGLVLIAGHSACLLNREDLELIGYEVHNCAVPGRRADGRRLQLYLARRPR